MEKNRMNRKLSVRHISMITIGGAIGTGLFIATGSIISQAGPGGAIMAYVIVGVMLYFLMSSIGELATFYPVSGGFSAYSTRFIDASLGFAMGWIYWIMWILVTSVDVIVAANVLSFWNIFNFFPSIIWSFVFITILILLNIFSVKSFGETTFWLSIIKVITIIIFIILGFFMIFGILGGYTYGFENYTRQEAPFVGGLSGFLGVLLVAGFSVGGMEVVAVTAGESDDPDKTMPKAIKQVFWYVLLFYILSIVVISAIIPYTDPLLLNKSQSVSQSPFTIVFSRVGIAFAASIINVVILTSLLSAANSGIYTTSRILYSLSNDRQAPKYLGKLNKATQMPFNAIITTFIMIVIIIIYANYNAHIIFSLLNIIGSVVIVVWGSSIWAQVMLRQAIKKQGKKSEDVLPYKSTLYPLGPIIVIVILLFLLIGSFGSSILNKDWLGLLRDISPFLIFITIYIVHKIIYKTRFVDLKKIKLNK